MPSNITLLCQWLGMIDCYCATFRHSHLNNVCTRRDVCWCSWWWVIRTRCTTGTRKTHSIFCSRFIYGTQALHRRDLSGKEVLCNWKSGNGSLQFYKDDLIWMELISKVKNNTVNNNNLNLLKHSPPKWIKNRQVLLTWSSETSK